MAIAIIAGVLILIFGVINPILKRFGKRKIDDEYAIPGGLFLIMCYLAYELEIPFLPVLIVFFFGLIIGALVENIHHKKQKNKEME